MIHGLLSRFLVFSTTILIACGCATNVGSVKFPESSQGFVPRRVYDMDIEKAWQAVNQALDANRISVLSADKASGRIQTDNIQGASAVYAGGLGGVGNSRYSYNIRLVGEDPRKVRITILAKLEQTLAGSSGATPYRDLTAQNRPLVTTLEDWLYEQIERAFGLVPELINTPGVGPQPTTAPPASQSSSPALPLAPTKEIISRVQVELKARGFDAGPPDGSIGSKTREALHKFQNAHRLRGTGEIDTATLEALGIR